MVEVYFGERKEGGKKGERREKQREREISKYQQPKRKIQKATPLIIALKIIKYLGISLTKEAKDIY